MPKYYLLIPLLFGLTACTDTKDESTNQPSSAAPAKIKNLNLELPDNKTPPSDVNGDLSKPDALPDLFDQEKKQDKVSVGGNVLRDEENLDYVNSVEGAEVSVEVKIP